MAKKTKKIRLNLGVSFSEYSNAPPMCFSCRLDSSDLKLKGYDFAVLFPFIPDPRELIPKPPYMPFAMVHVKTFKPHTGDDRPLPADVIEKTPMVDLMPYNYPDNFKPIAEAILQYPITKTEYIGLMQNWFPNLDQRPRTLKLKEDEYYPDTSNPYDRAKPKANDYFGDLLTKILEPAGYTVVIEVRDVYFPSPTSASLVAPVFSMGLQKKLTPTEIKEGYENEYIYLSMSKKQSKTQIQLKILDEIPEERIKELQRDLKDSLSPYGLKCLYLAIEECGRNTRSPWFILDTNRCLDLMGHKRDSRNIHYSKSKTRLLKEFEALTRINFNVERRKPKGEKNKDMAFKFSAPLISITGKFEEWEVERGQPLETGKKIKENVQLFLHPEIYKYVNKWYTFIPMDFLKIDIRSRPYALLLYSYIANQWRIGWHLYQGTIKQPMRQFLEGAGLLARIPKHATYQRKFMDRIENDLCWLKDQKHFWIKSVRIESKDRPFLEEMVIIRIAENHPLKTSMIKQISTK